MTSRRIIAPVIRRRRLGEDDGPEALTYWLGRTIEDRILEVEALRRMWIDRLGDPDRPMARVVTRRPLTDGS